MSIVIIPQPQPFAIPATYGLPGTSGPPGSDATDMGLLADAAAATIPSGIKKVSTRGRSALDVGGAKFVEGTAPTARSGFTSANSRNFVLSKEQVITTAMFYDAADPDYQNAIQGALDYCEAIAVDPVVTWYKAAPKIVIPASSTEYLLHDVVEQKHIGVIEGEDIGWFDSHATKLRWTAGITGFRYQDINTTGASGTTGGGGTWAPTGSVLRNLFLTGYLGTVSTEAENHAIHSKTRIRIEQIGAKDWQGDFIHINADVSVGGSNASFAKIDTCRAYRIRTGVYIDGGDANIIDVANVDIPYARRFCFWDSSFLSGGFRFCHASNGGAILQPGYTPTVCSVSGNQYSPVFGQEANAAVNAPSGTTADTAYWYYIGAGGVSAPLNVPAWSNGMAINSGGSYLVDGAGAPSVLQACYSEGGQGPVQMPGLGLAVGGTHSTPVRGAYIAGHGGKLAAYGGVSAENVATSTRSVLNDGTTNPDGILQNFDSANIGGAGAWSLGWNSFVPKLLHWTNWRNYFGLDACPFQISMNATPLADAPWGINRMNFPQGFGLEGKLFDLGTAAPTGAMPGGGNWAVGARRFNSAPAVGSPKSWVCTVAGSPGTWVSEGNL